MSDFQITGLSSGIDWGNIIDSMIDSKKAVTEQWTSEQDVLNDKITLYKELDNYLGDLENSMTPLEEDSTFQNRSAEISVQSGSESFISVTPSAEANIARHDIEVLTTAQNHRVAADRVDDITSALGQEGTFTLSTGSFEADVTLSAENSLSDAAAAINKAVSDKASSENIEIPLAAQIMDNTLILSSSKTGEDYAIEATDTDGVLLGLGVLNGSGEYSRELQTARDSNLKIDGLLVSRPSNSIDDLLEGITLDVNGQGTASVDIVMDAESAVTSIKNMVEAYNATMDWVNIRLSEKPAEDPQSDIEERWGLLKGDTMLWSAKEDMRHQVSKPRYDMSGEYKTLSSIGIATESVDYGKSGKLDFDESAFMEGMLKDPGSIKDLMQSFASDMKNFTESMVSTSTVNVGTASVKEGAITNRIDTLERQAEDISDRISQLNARLAMEKASLEAIYANMEANIAEMNQEASYITDFASMDFSRNNN